MIQYKNPSPSLPGEKEIEKQAENYENDIYVYFIFIDVLGFKDDYSSKERKKPGEKYKDLYMHYFDLLNSSELLKDQDFTYAGQMSDSLYFYTDRPDFLIEYIKFYSYFSLYAMQKKVFLRGGIAYGSLVKKKSYQVFGESIIKAYLLENEISNVPIVSIDKYTCTRIKEFLDKSQYEMLVYEDTNNKRYCLKPFYFLRQPECLKLTSFNRCTLEEIRRDNILVQINKQLQYFEYDVKVYPKYVYLHKKLMEETKQKEQEG